ncbi:Glycosyl hydrolases family 16 [Noviherbaspirillum humi]|uniref:Glycosyl hydrolases family 16 n=1 Tax=Noviherbaspirillum humi TaxID=1688639 RepID=A0A239GYG6_9BURK|nr:glycoside hydrolase family 16 protein [Noviherbaspirillum humi]SNS74167.1 Glycosyl hydrolases family 16 [Noviherbaspirillum humi]
MAANLPSAAPLRALLHRARRIASACLLAWVALPAAGAQDAERSLLALERLPQADDAGDGWPSAVTRSRRDAPASLIAGPYGQRAADYILTFSEEFDRSLDRSRWNDHIWYERPHPVRNYAVENGVLKIWPARDASGEFVKRTIDTDGKFEQRYGYFEMEAKLPRGKGLWPAFWLFAHPGERRPEIDIMEAYPGGVDPWGFPGKDGVPHPRAYGATTWFDKDRPAGTRQFDTGLDLSAGFHKYAVKWEPDQQTYYFDGKEVLKLQASLSDPMYILLDLWYGSSSGDPDATTPLGKGNAFEINYVRAWKFKGR